MIVSLTEADRVELESWVRQGATPQKQALRARMILLSAQGVGTLEIAARLGTTVPTLMRWRRRYVEAGVAGLRQGRTRPPGKAATEAAKIDEVLRLTSTGKPAEATHWSSRRMARATGLSATTVRQIWKQAGLAPHRVRGFKLSRDPRFEEKLRDVVGLYLDPPQKAIVFSVDEKSQIQELDRSQPGLPMKPGRAGTMTHDYKRHGTTTLFAALNVFEGSVIGKCLPRHRNDEFLKFLKHLERCTDPELALHLIVDNYATHKHPNVKAWLTEHPRVHLHFTPTSASWLNLVERFFRDLTEDQIRRGVFSSIKDLEVSIMRYLDQRNANPRPYCWTAHPNDIMAKVKRANDSLRALH
jgi:transposase